jgi:uncharacterized membrane protein YeaQ/YmgE (transglycosylase-associated protein family)
MLSLLGAVVFGLIVGALAKLVMPGKDPGDRAGFIMSTLGAIALLTAYRMITRRHA